MDVVSTVGLGGLLGAWQFARLMWPNGLLYNEPWVVLHPVLIGALAAMLLLGGLYRRRAHNARTEVEGQITQLAAQRDAAWEIAATAMKTGIEIGDGAGYDRGRREHLRRARLRAS